MQYELDPRLLPPTGASVQCTRCSFVFTALPSGQVLVPKQAPGEVSRTSNSSTTRIFGTPYAASPPQTSKAPGTADPDRTPAYGTESNPPYEPAASGTPALGSATPVSAPAVLGKTQVFGAPAPRPSPTTTQVFGAVSLPPAPSPTTTQVFGAVSLPATKPPSAATTQVFGASSIPTEPPTPTSTLVYGAASPGAKPKPAGRSASSGGKSDDTVPWMVEPGTPPSVSRGVTGERRAVAPPSAPVSLPPEEPVALPPPTPAPLPVSAPVSLPPDPLPKQGRVSGPSRRVPAFEQAPEVFDRIDRQEAGQETATGSGRERLLVILAAVVVLSLTAWLTYPAWRNQGAELPPEALRAKDEAVALLRRDDAASREQALARLRPLVAQFPKYTEAQAELGVALSLQLDDTQAELEWIGEQEAQLRKEIHALELAKDPADWSNRVNASKAELESLGTQRRPLEAAVTELTKQVEEALLVIRAAPETEPASDVVARLKAQAVHAGVTGNPQALALAERLRKVETPAQWSAISLAEYGLNARSPPASLEELAQSLQAVRERDNTFIRAYVLGARLALRQRDQATARSLLGTVETLNPNHALARKLRTWASTAPAR